MIRVEWPFMTRSSTRRNRREAAAQPPDGLAATLHQLAPELRLAREMAGRDGIVALLLDDQIAIVPPPWQRDRRREAAFEDRHAVETALKRRR